MNNTPLTPLARKVIYSDGRELALAEPQTLAQIEALIGCDWIDTVNLRDAGGHVMLLDDLGHKKGLPVNAKATALYWSVCRPGTTHPIVGNVVLVVDGDFSAAGAMSAS